MDDNQLDLFSGPVGPAPSRAAVVRRGPPPVDDLDDQALIAALDNAGILELPALAREAGRRRLTCAIPALEAEARLFAGFGAGGPVVREQAAILEALSSIGGARAAKAVRDLIERREVRGATLPLAMAAAARLDVILPLDVSLALLRHDDPSVRAGACRCASFQSAVVEPLLDLLNDVDPGVRLAAACGLGRRGHAGGLPVLTRALSVGPTVGIIEALAAVADEEAVVRLGREARRRPEFSAVILEALDGCDHPRAKVVAAGLRRA